MIRWSAHLSMLFTEHAAEDRPAAAARSGFRTVETWWPAAGDLDAWVRGVREHQLAVAAVNADGGDIAAGERGFCCVPGAEDRVLAALRDALALARRVDAPVVNVLAGLLVPDVPAEHQRAQAVEVLRECGRVAGAAGRTVVVEPINGVDVPGYLVTTPSAAADLIAEVGSDHVRMLYDAYHAAMAGGDPVRDVGAHADVIGHVQYADCPGRGAPGTGRTDLAAFVERLEAIGYRGAVGLEFTPGGPTVDAVGRLVGLSPVAPFPGP